ncbi:MAG: hypothetical protein Q4A32_08945 [Lachnospiraceae bacterium]|nr:hypothetical protein [Lachnospiraceae bacterium]
MVSRIIDRYVDEVTQQLPIGVRKAAERSLKDVIYEKLDDYTDGQRAVTRDVRAVLREMGTPDELADAYYKEIARRKKNKKRDAAQNLEEASSVVLGVSVMLVVLGLILLACGVTSNVFPILLGAVMALSVMLSKTFGSTIKSIDTTRRKMRESKAGYGDEEDFF